RARVQLDPPGAVDHVEERRLPLSAPRGQPPGDPRPHVGLLPVGKVLVRRLDRSDRLNARELMRERLDPLIAQRGELAPALLDELVAHVLATSILVILSLRALPFGSMTS